MTQQLTIRDAERDDLPVIVDIYNSTIESRMVTADLEPVTVEERIAWFEAHTSDKHPLWVVERESQIIAWFSFQPFYGRPAYDATAEISIYISEACRGQSIGRWLLEYAIEACPRIGVKTMLAFVFGHNQPSLALLQKLYFEPWGHLPKVAVLDGVERDLVILGRRV